MKKLSLLFVVVISIVFMVSCVSKEVPVTETYYETQYNTEYKTETYTTTGNVVTKTIEGSNFLSPKTQWRTPWVYLIQSQSTDTCYYGYDIGSQQHAKGQVQISFLFSQPIYKGLIKVIDLTDACTDQSIPFVGLLFGKEPTTSTDQMFIPAEGCQVIDPQVLGDVRAWLDGMNTLTGDPKRILETLSIDKETANDSITFDAKGIKEFAILVGVQPRLSPPNIKLTWADDVIEKKTVTEERQVPYQVPVQVEKQRTVIQTKKVPFWEVWKAKPAAETPSLAPVPPTEESSPQLLYEDDFSNPKSGWTQASGEEGESYYKDGEFHGIVNKWDWASWQYNRNAGRFGDFTIEEDMRLVNGPSNSSYGLIFRCQDDNNFYRFLISANGNYLVGTKLDGKWTELQKWTMSEYVGKGNSTNHLKVVCKGSHIEVYVNEHYLTTVIDTSFAEGYIGGIIDTPEPNTHVAFDNFRVYSLD